VNISVQMEF